MRANVNQTRDRRVESENLSRDVSRMLEKRLEVARRVCIARAIEYSISLKISERYAEFRTLQTDIFRRNPFIARARAHEV